MKKLHYIFGLLILLLLFFSNQSSFAQINIMSGQEVTPEDLVESIVGEGLIYSNVNYQGADSAKGIFTNGQTTNLGLESGIVLTSGLADTVVGPNQSFKTGINNGLGGHALLDQITTHTTYDACVLEFDFIPEFDTLRFKYVFGSEDYSEWVGGAFNDVFGLFISGPNPDGGLYEDKNIAIVPGTSNTSVTVNNINNGYSPAYEVPTGPCTNCQYFSDNTFGLTLEYDGLTTVLIAWVKVIPYESYHLLMGVADAGDHIGDCGVFLEENSIECKFPRITAEVNLQPPGILDNMLEEFIYADITFNLLYPDEFPITFEFELSGTADPSAYYPDGGDFEEEVPTQITFEEGEDSITIQTKAVYDGIIEGDEYLDLIIEIPYTNYSIYDTLTLTILDYLEMNSQTSPNTMICFGQELDMWVHIYYGIPPYTYYWEPGGYTTDSITAIPEESMTYKVTYSDMFTSKSDSIQVTVFPLNYEVFSFSFETENNPSLFADINGEIFEDSISLDVPLGMSLDDLVATFDLSYGAWAMVNGEDQISGITVNDFSNTVTYEVIAPGGCMKDWEVNVNLVTGQSETEINKISIYPNPAKDKIYISNAKENKLRVLNSLGTVVMERIIDEDKLNLDVSEFIDGVYYLQFSNSEQWFVEKIIVNR